jgi:hypothetical protein
MQQPVTQAPSYEPRFPPLCVSDYSLCNEFVREPRWKPLLTEEERGAERARQSKEAAKHGEMFPFLEGPFEPLNAVSNTVNDVFLTGQAVLKITPAANREFNILTYLESKELPVVSALATIGLLSKDHYAGTRAVLTELHGQSLDWTIFHAYPDAGPAALEAAQDLGTCIARFENAGILLYDSHISNFAYDGRSTVRLDVEPVRWKGMREEFLSSDDLHELKCWGASTEKLGIRRCEETVDIAESIRDSLFKCEVLKFPEHYRYVTESTYGKWGVEMLDPEHDKETETLHERLFERYMGAVLAGYRAARASQRPIYIGFDPEGYHPGIAALLNRHGVETTTEHGTMEQVEPGK